MGIMRILKISGIVIISFFLLITGAVQLFLTEGMIRDYVIKPVEETTPYRIDFAEFDAGIFGGLHMNLENLTVVDTNRIDQVPLTRIGEIRIHISIWRALTGNIAINELVMSDGVIDILEMPFETHKTKPVSVDTVAPDSSGIALPEIRIPLISLNRFRIHYQKTADSLMLHVNGLNLATTFYAIDDSISVQSELGIDTIQAVMGSQSVHTADQSFRTDLSACLNVGRFIIRPSSFRILTIPGEFEGIVNTKGHGPTRLTVKGDGIELDQFLAQLESDVKNQFTNVAGRLDYRADYTTANGDTSLNYGVTLTGLTAGMKGTPASIQNVSGKISGDLNGLTIETLKLVAENQTLQVSGTLGLKPHLKPDVRVQLNADLRKLAAFNDYLPDGILLNSGNINADVTIRGEMRDNRYPDIQGRLLADRVKLRIDSLPEGDMTINGDLRFNQNSLQLNRLDYQSALTDVRLNGRVNGIFNHIMNAAPLDINLALQSNRINVTPYMSAGEEVETTSAQTSQSSSDPFPSLIPYRLTLSIGLQDIIADQIRIRNVNGQVTNRNRRLQADLNRADIFDGSVAGRVAVNYRNGRNAVETDLRLSNLSFNTAMTELFEKPGTFYGQLNTTGSLNMTLLGVDSVIEKSINGNLDYTVYQMKLVNIKALKKLSSSIKFFDFDTLRSTESSGEMIIADEAITFSKIELAANDFNMTSKNGRYHFDGRLQFPIEMRLSANASKQFIDRQSGSFKELVKLARDKNKQILIKPTLIGRYDSPDVKLDWSHAKKNAGDALKKKAKNLLKKLF